MFFQTWTLSIFKKIIYFEVKRYTNTMSSKRIAVCQMTSVADKVENMNVVSKLITEAAKENVQVIYIL